MNKEGRGTWNLDLSHIGPSAGEGTSEGYSPFAVFSNMTQGKVDALTMLAMRSESEKNNDRLIVEAENASSKGPNTAHTFRHVQQITPSSPQLMSIQQGCHEQDHNLREGRVPNLRRMRLDNGQDIRR